jgi:hypothetical protein
MCNRPRIFPATPQRSGFPGFIQLQRARVVIWFLPAVQLAMQCSSFCRRRCRHGYCR